MKEYKQEMGEGNAGHVYGSGGRSVGGVAALREHSKDVRRKEATARRKKC